MALSATNFFDDFLDFLLLAVLWILLDSGVLDRIDFSAEWQVVFLDFTLLLLFSFLALLGVRARFRALLAETFDLTRS